MDFTIHSIQYLIEIVEKLKKIDHKNLSNIIDLITNKVLTGYTLLIAGNGGSAASAAHIAADLSNDLYHHKPSNRGRILSLCDSASRLTALANDYGYENIFVRQLDHAKKGDVLLLLSVSGESPNILRALEETKELGVISIAIAGKDSTLSNNSDLSFVFGNGDFGHGEDFQTIFHHTLKRRIAEICTEVEVCA